MPAEGYVFFVVVIYFTYCLLTGKVDLDDPYNQK